MLASEANGCFIKSLYNTSLKYVLINFLHFIFLTKVTDNGDNERNPNR